MVAVPEVSVIVEQFETVRGKNDNEEVEHHAQTCREKVHRQSTHALVCYEGDGKCIYNA